jgi:GWxTD domain-containing protein
MVVAFNGDVRAYAVALASLEENRSLNYQIVLAASGGNLMKRIRRLLYPQRPNGAWGPVIAVAILLLTATAGLAAWQAQQSSTDTWLNEDVVYIITAPERAAFLNLTTDDERQKFIEQFWLRRDPAGAPPNTFKAEHYHRIAVANKHFKTTSGQPGWQTDRGHIWIIYGPPDEIDSHPRKFEDWLYNHLEGIGNHVDFHYIDPTGSGDFKLAPGSPTK